MSVAIQIVEYIYNKYVHSIHIVIAEILWNPKVIITISTDTYQKR